MAAVREEREKNPSSCKIDTLKLDLEFPHSMMQYFGVFLPDLGERQLFYIYFLKLVLTN